MLCRQQPACSSSHGCVCDSDFTASVNTQLCTVCAPRARPPHFCKCTVCRPYSVVDRYELVRTCTATGQNCVLQLYGCTSTGL
eukprot:COSAG01_NODE_1706_length_9427_cov_51.196934_3_plen_83_part_00